MALKAISTAALPLRQWPAPGEWTYEDYFNLPDDGNRYEVIYGELYLMAPVPSPLHQRISRNLEFLLWTHVQAHDLGEVLDAPCDVIMGTGATPVQPDVIFISKVKLDIITKKNITGVPDLLVEILSASNPEHDREIKFNLYAQSGVAEYWIVDSEAQTVEVFALNEGAYSLLGRFGSGEEVLSKVVAGFRVAVDEVFPTEKI